MTSKEILKEATLEVLKDRYKKSVANILRTRTAPRDILEHIRIEQEYYEKIIDSFREDGVI